MFVGYLGFEYPEDVVCREDTNDIADLQRQFYGGETGRKIVSLWGSDGHWNTA